jgi:hypothetical protein
MSRSFCKRHIDHVTRRDQSSVSMTSLQCTNAAQATNDNTSQATPPPSAEAERWQDKQLGPSQQSVRDSPLATELDRFQVMSVEDGYLTSIWLRLIGPGLCLNIKLAAPESDYVGNSLKISVEAIPECHRDIIEIEVKTRSYFAGLLVFNQQHGLHWWDFSQVQSGQKFTACLFWACVYNIAKTTC